MKRRAFLRSCFGAAAGLKGELQLRKTSLNPGQAQDNPLREKSILVKVLGTAQDGGIPHYGCFCPNCQRAWKFAEFSRFIASLALFDFAENKAILIDATPDIRVQTMTIQERIKSYKKDDRYWPDGILLTHAHIGHYTGLMFYGYEALSTDRVPVYCSRRMIDFLTQNGPWSQLVSQKNIILRPISPEKTLPLTSRIGISALPVPHRAEYTDTFGYRITGPNRSLLYIPDIQNWTTWDRSFVEEIQKVDIALLDGTFFSSEELPSRDMSSIGHPLISDTMKLIKDMPGSVNKQILFTHLNHSNLALDPEGEARNIIEKNAFALAEDGMEFPL